MFAGSAAAQVFPKKLGQRLSERTASTAKSKLQCFNQFAKTFQHE